MEGVGLSEKAKTNKKNPGKWIAEDNNGQSMKMEVSGGRTRELGSTVSGRRARWEKPVARGSLT